MKTFFIITLFIPLLSNAQGLGEIDAEIMEFMQLHANDDTASTVIGTVGNGSLKHGKLIPFQGPNFKYFDRDSYLAGRAFTMDKVKNTLIASYDSLYNLIPNRMFRIMECSNKEGGELFPHKSHQNGMSIDLMMPLIQNDQPYYLLDDLGAKHYGLDFDDEGKYLGDKSVMIDFNLVAKQILIINHYAKLNGISLTKVIIKIELKDELYASEYGQILKASGIYVVHGLSPIINDLHDDHFHLDFGFPYPKTEREKRVNE